MLRKLNFYSRYNRIKEHHDIHSLYTLINGLNIDALLSEEDTDTVALPSSSLRANPVEKNQKQKKNWKRVLEKRNIAE